MKQLRPKKSLLIIGYQKVKEAIEAGEQVDRIYLAYTVRGKQADEIRDLAEKFLIPINKVPLEKINSFNVTGHDGLVALKGKVKYQHLQQIISFTVEKGETPLFVILDGITDIRNIGAIARTALCCGVHAIIIPDKGIGALNEDAIAVSAGALEELPVCRVNSLVKAVDELHLNGIMVYASEMTATDKIYDIKFDGPSAFVLGSEDKGVHPTLRKVCDGIFNIPMKGNFESLNVSVAAGMILYEAMKQRECENE